MLPETLALADLLLPSSHLDTDYKRRLDAKVEENGLADHVELTGRVDRADPLDLYRRHSISMFPSLWEEPMGISILEAMACGLVVISSGTGGSAELFVDWESGLRFKSEDSQELAGKLEMILENPRRMHEMGINAVQKCIPQYQIRNTISSIKNNIKK